MILRSDDGSPTVALLAENLGPIRLEGLERSLEQHPVPDAPAGNEIAEVGVQHVKGCVAPCDTS